MTFKFSKRSLNNLKGIHPKLVRLMHECIKTTPIDFVITEGVRSEKRQKELYELGRSKCDGIIKKSNHQIKDDGYGYAVDIYPIPVQYHDLQPYKDLSEHIKATAKILEIKVAYGGDWKSFKDYPHWELKS